MRRPGNGPWHSARVNDGDALDWLVVDCGLCISMGHVVESYPGLPLCGRCTTVRLLANDGWSTDDALAWAAADFENFANDVAQQVRSEHDD